MRVGHPPEDRPPLNVGVHLVQNHCPAPLGFAHRLSVLAEGVELHAQVFIR